MTRSVSIDDGPVTYRQTVSVGPHVFHADEPAEAGGNDAGPGPYELLLASLGTCATITVRMYANRKQWPLLGVHADLSWIRINPEHSTNGEQTSVDGIQMKLTFVGDLTETQRQRLLEIAGRCPVHRTLSSPIQIFNEQALTEPRASN